MKQPSSELLPPRINKKRGGVGGELEKMTNVVQKRGKMTGGYSHPRSTPDSPALEKRPGARGRSRVLPERGGEVYLFQREIPPTQKRGKRRLQFYRDAFRTANSKPDRILSSIKKTRSKGR